MENNTNSNTWENAFQQSDPKTNKEIIYIVAASKASSHAAELLKMLISEKVNCKCQIYSEEQYIDNKAKESSDNNILFIGEINKNQIAMADKSTETMKKYGLQYKQRGRQAQLLVITRIPIFDSKDFLAYYNALFEESKLKLSQYTGGDFALDDFFMLFVGGPIAVGIKNIAKSPSRLIKEAQYMACVMEFYNHGLEDFLKSIKTLQATATPDQL